MFNENFVFETLQNLIASDKTALDIGANHGVYTAVLAQKFGKVFAFEPHPDNLPVLAEKTKAYNNVQIVPRAIAEKTGFVKMFVNPYNPGGHSISPAIAATQKWGHNPNHWIAVPTVSLDEFCKDIDVSFIKCDIEGAENYIFNGATEMLTRCKPTIILEVHMEVDCAKLFKLFADLGYTAKDKDGPADKFINDAHYLLTVEK